MRIVLRVLSAAVLAVAAAIVIASPPCAASGVGASTAASRTPFPSLPSAPPPGLDEATRQAEELQRRVDELQAEAVVLDGRVRSLGESVARQAEVVRDAQAGEEAAHQRFDERVVGMYKSGNVKPLEIVIASRTFSDALRRGAFLLAIADRDRQLLESATRRSSDAAYEAQTLEQLRDREMALRAVHQERLLAMRTALEQQRAIVAGLNEQQRRYLADQEAAEKARREQWKTSGFAGSTVPKVPAEVEGMPGVPFLVDQGEPLRYRAVDQPRTMVCSWYGNADNAPTPTATASGRAFNENEFTCASRTLPFGTRLALSRGDRHVIVVVTDRGPYIDGRDLDLSRSAASALGLDGVGRVTARTVVPAP